MVITLIRMIGGTLFEWLIFPILMGNMFLKITGRDKDAGYMFYGYPIVFALFYMVSLPMIYYKRTLLEMSYVWMILQGMATVISLFFVKSLWEDTVRSVKRFRFQLRWVEMVWFMIMGCSLLFVVPESSDTIIVTTLKIWYTNRMYVFDPFTGAAYAEMPWHYAACPLPAYYAVSSRICHIHPAIMVKYVAAFFCMLLFLMAYRFTARRLFTKKDKQDLFMVIVILLHTGLLFSQSRGNINILQNAWSGRCLLVNYLVVVVFSLGLELSLDLKQTVVAQLNRKYYIGFFVVLVFASEMFSINGVFYTVVSAVVLLLVVWIERRKHASISKHDRNIDAD